MFLTREISKNQSGAFFLRHPVGRWQVSEILNLDPLEFRRNNLSLKFAVKSEKHLKIQIMV